MFGTYIAPSDSPYYNTTEFSNVANMFIPLNYNRVVFGGGDLNGRVGDITYSLPSKNMEYLPSDHAPLSVSFKLNLVDGDFRKLASADLLSEPAGCELVKPKYINSSRVNWDTFYSLIETDFDSYKHKIEVFSVKKSLKSLDSVVSAFSNSFYNAAKANTIQVRQHADPRPHGGIFDVIDDIFARHQRGRNDNGEWRRLREEAVEHVRKDVSYIEHMNWKKVLNSKDAKTLWKEINWKGTFSQAEVSKKPELDDLAAHFAEKGKAGHESTILCEVNGVSYVPVLDDDITTEEIISAQKRLKEDKSSGDGWVKNMLSNLPKSLLLVLQLMYNTILKCHIFPTSWRTTVVNEIFKQKGSPEGSKNYRAISLVHLLAKLFDFILLGRFKKWFVPADEQTAYQTKKGSADHVFLLRCMTQYAKRFKKTIFTRYLQHV